MTNHVTLRIIPGRIDTAAWRAVYEETLVLLKQFPFYMVVSGPGGVFCAARAAHQSRLQLKDCGGWSLDGDLYCGTYQRGFLLFDNIEYYCTHCSKSMKTSRTCWTTHVTCTVWYD